MADVIEFRCACNRRLKAPASAAGRRGRCPACNDFFTVPTPAKPLPDPDFIPDDALAEADEDPFAEPEVPQDDFGEIPLAPAPRQAAAPPRGTSFAAATHIPAIAPIPQPTLAYQAAPRPVMSLAADPEPDPSSRPPYIYLVLLLSLIPLAALTFSRDNEEHSFKTRIAATVKHHPEIASKLEELSEDATLNDLFKILPDHRLDGAMLPRDTWAHWVYAFIAGIVFVAVASALFPRGYASLQQLITIGVFTGTLGILLLLAFQFLAFHMPLFTPRGFISLMLDLIWLIGQSYALTEGNHGFLLSFIGFTAGVGLCEEICKAIPMLFMARGPGDDLGSWRKAMLWGLISGAGFGVSEGISYASRYYNGISTANIYWVRFVSCVGLHAIWSAAAGISIYRHRNLLQQEQHPLSWLFQVVAILLVPMTLHGLYDTLLSQKYDVYALIVALASFAWLAFQIERAKRTFDEPNPSFT